MLSVIGDYLGFAIGIALSPMAIVGFILMLVSAGGLPKAWGFVAGWAAGTTIVLLLVGTLVSAGSDDGDDSTSIILGLVRIALGILMVGLAWRQWQGRPKADEQPSLPSWMQAMDTVTPVKAVGLGAFLSALNPKNLPLLISTAGVIGQASLGGTETTIVALIFIILACLGMLVPIVVFLVAGEKGAAMLDEVREWLVGNNATIMAVLFLILGVSIIGKGLSAL